jgi:hypothetical protein
MIRKATAVSVIVFALTVLPPKRLRGEEYLASKILYYAEDKDRIKVFAPTFALQRESLDGWTIKVDGIFNSISGATPTGAPTPLATPAVRRTAYYSRPSTPPPPSGGGDDEDDQETDTERDSFISAKQSTPAAKFSALSAATPSNPPPSGGGSTPPPAGGTGSSSTTVVPGASASSAQAAQVPTVDFSDERVGLNIGVSKRIGRHTPGGQLSYSSESDYTSLGLSLQDAVDFNRKNTTLVFGGAYTHDMIAPANSTLDQTKDTVDLMLGVTQVLSPSTLLTLNLSVGQVNGFISDPYKVVEMNGVLKGEKRPDSKDKQILYVALDQFIAPLNGTAEISLRHYQDGFGVTAETLTLEWFQKIGEHFILAPLVRYYDQTEADFYAVRFTGNPEFYSSDYRISSFSALGYGLRLIWSPTQRLSLDVGVEQYDQEGSDGVTPQVVYPTATAVTAGIRIAL